MHVSLTQSKSIETTIYLRAPDECMLFSSRPSRNFVILWRRSQFQLQLHTTLSKGSQRGTGSLALFKGIRMVVGGLPTPKDASQKKSSYKYYQICQICTVCPIVFCQFLYNVLLYPEERPVGSGRLNWEREKSYLQILLELFMWSYFWEVRFDSVQAVGRNPLSSGIAIFSGGSQKYLKKGSVPPVWIGT